MMLQQRPRTLAIPALVVAALALVALLAFAPARWTAQADPHDGPSAELPPVPLPVVVPPGAGPPIAGPPLELFTEVVNLVSVETSATEDVEASASVAGASAGVMVPAGVLPRGTTIEIAAVINIEEIIAQAPVATFADVDRFASFTGTFAQGIAGTNDPARLASIQSSPVESMFGVFANQWVVYIPGAPAFVNNLTSEILTPDTPLIVRFLNLAARAAFAAE